MEGTLSQGTKGQEGYVPQNVTVDTAAETFVRDGLSKVMKITNICDSEHLTDCGLPDKIVSINGNTAINLSNITSLAKFNDKFSGKIDALWTDDAYEQLDTKAAAFETINGESVLVYYNPNCQQDLELVQGYRWWQPYMCANFVYDLNGKKGPNTAGKDIGVITALYSINSAIVAPNPYPNDLSETMTLTNGLIRCKEMDSNARVPNKEELASLFYNKKLFNMLERNYWSSFSEYTNMAWVIGFNGTSTRQMINSNQHEFLVRCIKR